MSLKKKDQSTGAPGGLRVAANDPHLVSLGGGRLSTAVTIHYIPVGDTTIGSSPKSKISLNGQGVQPLHCTVFRSENGEVTIVPENDSARVLIDGNRVGQDASLTQGAMLTIGNSNYLRFNNPAEAELIRSTMGSNERISMPQIDFGSGSPDDVLKGLNDILHESQYQQQQQNLQSNFNQNSKSSSPSGFSVLEKITNFEYFTTSGGGMNGFLHSPKVFTADSVTVNAPAKDVLGPKYANFAKNLAENHKNDKNYSCSTQKNNEIPLKINNYVNIPSSFIQNRNNSQQQQIPEVLSKVPNSISSSSRSYMQSGTSQPSQPAAQAMTYDRYPKYGGLQLFPMNRVNSEINSSHLNGGEELNQGNRLLEQKVAGSHISEQENERLEEILKICAEYDRQQLQHHQTSATTAQSSLQSSPIVQNRIKTNGSLPRDFKKSPYSDLNGVQTLSPHHYSQKAAFFSPDSKNMKSPSTGYENVKFVGDRRIEIGVPNSSPIQKNSTGYENVIIGKYIPQSPRTKIRTTCMSPKKEPTLLQLQSSKLQQQQQGQQSNEYAQLIQSFEDKLRNEIEAIKNESIGIKSITKTDAGEFYNQQESPKKRQNKNINNLTLNLQKGGKRLPDDDPSPSELATFTKDREKMISFIRKLKTQIADLRRQEDEVLREMDMEKALVSAEFSTVKKNLKLLESKLATAQAKIHRLEAQRNANRVMQETQQSKLKQSIEVKQEQITTLESLANEKQSELDLGLKEELEKMIESLENDRKIFEDLEFQYLEEETDWLAYREELHSELLHLTAEIEETQIQLIHLESEKIENHNTASNDTKTIENDVSSLISQLEKTRKELHEIDGKIFKLTGQQQSQSDSDEDESLSLTEPSLASIGRNATQNLMPRPLFGSSEILATKSYQETVNLMSKSVNENMFFNNRIEMLPPGQNLGASSQQNRDLLVRTPKKNLTVFNVSENVTKIAQNGHKQLMKAEDLDITPDIVRRDHHIDENDAILKLKYNVEAAPNSPSAGAKTNNLNLSLGSDDFEVNPLDKRVPSQDDIDRICKVTLDAPIQPTKLGIGASSKIIESIKEIERNRQLLLAQQGSHVIEHERQKMLELKKRSQDEATAHYKLLQESQKELNNIKNTSLENIQGANTKIDNVKNSNGDFFLSNYGGEIITKNNSSEENERPQLIKTYQQEESFQRDRPLSESNSEMSYDNLSEKQFKSSNDLTNNRLSENSGDTKRYSFASTGTMEGADRLVSGSKRTLPKHQRPLTRYLPIMSPDLDLRQHIETAGHQVTLCPHVYVDSYSCRGYLHKLGATFHGWSRRWFVLDRQKNALIYYSDKSEKKPRGGAYFSTIDEVYLDHLNTSKSGRPHCTFIVKTKKRSYHLQAASDAAARIWIDSIITGAQGNIDY